MTLHSLPTSSGHDSEQSPELLPLGEQLVRMIVPGRAMTVARYYSQLCAKCYHRCDQDSSGAARYERRGLLATCARAFIGAYF